MRLRSAEGVGTTVVVRLPVQGRPARQYRGPQKVAAR
ncbi:hypothetical protein METHPM2_2990001 [Pseudomonas sp. PM2]